MILPTIELELELLKKYQTVIALDEVGRGPWAGPLVLGLIRLDQSFLINQEQQQLLGLVRDSKLLTPKKRQNLAGQIQDNFSGRIFLITNQEIDKSGVQRAQTRTVEKIVEEFSSSKTFFLLDMMRGLKLTQPHQMIVKGDAQHASIAAASIVAKVYRDNLMIELDQEDDRYAFAQHKGYGTALHLAKLKEHGPGPHHRLSYKPVAKLLAKD